MSASCYAGLMAKRDPAHIGETLDYIRKRTGASHTEVSAAAGAVRGKAFNRSWASGVVTRQNVELATIVNFARGCGCSVKLVITLPGDELEEVVLDC